MTEEVTPGPQGLETEKHPFEEDATTAARLRNVGLQPVLEHPHYAVLDEISAAAFWRGRRGFMGHY